MNSLSTRLANDQYNNKDALDTNKVVLDSITSSKDQLSGVSLDEEAANMMIYVSSYNAAAKIMTAFDETLETLLGIV
jgi:flagellar hook-associated protein 1 FlgK